MKASRILKLFAIPLLTVSMLAAFAVPSQAAGGRKNQMFGRKGGMGQQDSSAALADAPGEIVTDETENAASALTANPENAVRLLMSDSDNSVKITQPGTYIVSGICGDGTITVKKGTTGVVLILEDLTLSSSTGAPISINKSAQVHLIVSGSVTLTDSEDPADEGSSDSEAAEAYDGAALKIKSGAQV